MITSNDFEMLFFLLSIRFLNKVFNFVSELFYRNNEVQFAGEIQPRGCSYRLHVLSGDDKVVDALIQVVCSFQF